MQENNIWLQISLVVFFQQNQTNLKIISTLIIMDKSLAW